MDLRRLLLENPLGQFALGAFALVVGAALLFTLIGAVSDVDEQASGVVIDDPTQPAATDTTAPTTSVPTDGATDVTGTPTEGSTDGPTEAPTETATTATEEPTASDGVDPARVSIQVLDAVRSDGGASRDAVVACLEAAGYRGIITNSASVTYAETAVFWTGDNEAEGRHVAAAIGVTRVERKPDRVGLSDSVQVHVVVGADASDPC